MPTDLHPRLGPGDRGAYLEEFDNLAALGWRRILDADRDVSSECPERAYPLAVGSARPHGVNMVTTLVQVAQRLTDRSRRCPEASLLLIVFSKRDGRCYLVERAALSAHLSLNLGQLLPDLAFAQVSLVLDGCERVG